MHFAIIALISVVVARISISLGARLGLVDHPDARKQHSGTVALTGGVFIFLTILLGTLFLGIEPYTAEMMVIAIAVFLVGVFDDFQQIHAGLRLLIQYVAGALLATYGGIAIDNVGNLLAFGDIYLLLLTIPLTALSVAGLSNAYNMTDGIDGLAASTIALPLLALYCLAIDNRHPEAEFLMLMLIPLGVFLIFNLGPNNNLLPKVFLGDGGSITLGFLVTASLVHFSQGDWAVIEPVTALWMVTVPLMDMLATMLRRYRSGRKVMDADRSHLHHTLMDMGFTPRQTLTILVVYATGGIAVGLALEAVPAYVNLAVYFLVFGLHCAFVLDLLSIQSRE